MGGLVFWRVDEVGMVRRDVIGFVGARKAGAEGVEGREEVEVEEKEVL